MRKAETTGIPGQVEIDEDTTLDVKKIEEAERGWINKCKADPRYGQVHKKMLEKMEDKLGDDYRMHSFEITQTFDAMALTGIRLMYDRIKEDQYTIQELTKQRDTFKTRLMEAQTEQLREVSELRSKIRTLQNKEEFNPEDYDEPPMWYEACNYLDEGEQELVQLIVIEKVKLALSKGEGTRMILEEEARKRKLLEDRIAELKGELEALQQLYDTMKQDLEKQRAQFEENIKELQAKLEAAGISDGTPEPTRDRSGAKELMMLKEENANLKEEIKDLKAQIRELEAMRKKLQGELDRLKTGGAPGDHDSDAASRARTPKEEELGKKVRELEAEIARLKKVLEQMEKRAKDAESKLSAMEREFAKLQTQMKSLRDAIARGETPPAGAMDDGPVVSAGTDFPDQSELVENLRKENADLKAELEKMRMKMKQLEDEFAEKVAALKAQIAGLENQLEEASV
jgi:phage shock protein A